MPDADYRSRQKSKPHGQSARWRAVLGRYDPASVALCDSPLYAAGGSVSIADIISFINSAPARAKDVTSPEWQKRSFMYAAMDAAARHPRVRMPRAALTDNLNFWA